jgi:3D (Asp-Asp-Asp) domain-containing protein
MRQNPFSFDLPLRALIVLVAAAALNLPAVGEAAPAKGTATVTLYYVFEADGEEPASGSSVSITTVEGEKLRVRVSPSILKKANLEGTVTSVDPEDGKRYVTSIVKLGMWTDLADGWEGMGNRTNPLTTYRTVAADQKQHAYGSRIYAPILVGEEILGWDEPHDGYLWVADSGGGIKGWMRFDVFVGKQKTYEWVMDLENQKGKWKVPVEVEKLPGAPSGYSPKTDSGVRKILSGLDLLQGGDSKEEVAAALTAFQKQHHHIPEAGYGSARGAITLWYLTQAALKVAKGEVYDAGVASSRPKSD